MQLRRLGSYRGIEYIVRLTEHGLRYAMIKDGGLIAIVNDDGKERTPIERDGVIVDVLVTKVRDVSQLPSLEDIQKQLDVYLDECALEWG